MCVPGNGSHKREYTKFIDLLAPIFNIKYLKSLRVRFVVNCSRYTPLLRLIEKLEEVLAPTIHRLHHSGAQVAWFRRDEDFEPPHANDMPALSRDYALSVENLMDDIANNSFFVSDSRFQSCHKILTAIGCKWLLRMSSLLCCHDLGTSSRIWRTALRWSHTITSRLYT
jgi:hypothetical protein